LYYLPNIITVITSRRKRWVGHIEHMWDMRKAYKILVGTPERKRPRGRFRRRRKYHSKL